MKIWYKFYQDDIIYWDLLLKSPSLLKGHYKKNAFKAIYPQLEKMELYMKLPINNDSDFKIIKALRFYNDLFKKIPISLNIDRAVTTSSYNKADKYIKFKLRCNKYLSIYFSQMFCKNILKNILKKQLPYSFGIDRTGLVSISFKDIGEIGLKEMKYDYFNWSSPFIIKLYFINSNVKYINLLVSYLNFKFKN